jgi:hypothetical protein
MYLRYLILISMIILSCSPKISNKTAEAAPSNAASTATPSAGDIPYTVADRYFVRNDYKREDHLNPKITSKAAFDSIFGMAPVVGSKPTAIDFSTQYVVSVIGEPTDKKTEIIPLSLKQEEGTVVLNYKLVVGEKRSVTIQPVLIIGVDNKYGGEVKLLGN